MLVRGHFVCHVHCLVHDGVVRSSLCGPHHENFGRNLYHMFVPAYSASQSFVFFLSCGIRVASMSNVDSIPFLSGVSYSFVNTNPSSSSRLSCQSFSPVCFSSSGSDHFNIRKIQSQLSQWCSFHPSQAAFVFLPAHPCFFKDSEFFIKYPSYGCEASLLLSFNVLIR